MLAAGIRVIDTYVEWALHNPEPGVYNWEGLADLEYFLDLTQKLNQKVILRPGPYICAERDNVSRLDKIVGAKCQSICSLLCLPRGVCLIGYFRNIPALKLERAMRISWPK